MTHTIRLNGIVGIDILPQVVEMQIAELKIQPADILLVEVNSPGGTVTDGFALYNLFQNINCTVEFRITGIAMSIMSLIILAGDKVTASPVSMLMIHKASVGLEGNADELRKEAETLDKIDSILIELYFKRNQEKGGKKLSREELEKMLSAETYLNPDEALQYGFIDAIEGEANLNAAAQMKDLILKSNMKHLEKLRRLLAMSDRPKVEDKSIKDAFIKALGQKKWVDLTEEEQAQLIAQVKTMVSEIIGDTLTEQEAEQVLTAIQAAVSEMVQPEEAVEDLRQEIAALRELLEASAKSNIELAEAVNNQVTELQNEIVALKKSARSFSQKPFVNETSRSPFNAKYVDPYAKHRAEMAEIESRTRNQKLKNQ